MLNISPVIVWTVALSQLLTFGLTVWNLVMSGSRANAKQISDHADLLADHGGRIASLEQSLVALPAKEDLHKLTLALSDFRGELREIRASQNAAAEMVRRQEIVISRVEQYLLENGKK
ncbi:DUF2730 family protein [Paracoccus denitrificans]|uniref:DUF2730 family protein n=1 Tax=Paracoccus denitrificans TaxID=266 RepID=UPI003364C36F